MAKIVKTKKEKKLLPLYIFLLILISFFYFGWSIFINTYKTNLIREIQETEYRINELRAQNKILEDQIAVLGNKETIFAFAEENGLQLNMENIVSVVD